MLDFAGGDPGGAPVGHGTAVDVGEEGADGVDRHVRGAEGATGWLL